MSDNNSNWGLCKVCKWWQVEQDATLEDQTVGVCVDEELQEYVFRVSGNSGCNRFMAGEPRRRKGSSGLPPTPELVDVK